MDTKKIDIKEVPENTLERFKLEITEYSRVFLESRAIMEEQKGPYGTISMDRLTDIFAAYVTKKNQIINLYFKDEYKEKEETKIFLKEIFTSLSGPEKRGEEKEFFEEIEFLKKAGEKYIETYEKLKDERLIYLVDANVSIEDTWNKVKEILDIHLNSK